MRLLKKIETAGNRLPHPTLLFIYLCGLMLVLSLLFSLLGVDAKHPVSGELISAKNLLSKEGLQLILSKTVSNFTQFAPVGSVLIAILGIGVAEQSGLIAAVLRATVQRAPKQLLSFFVVLTGILSSLALDTGYVVLIPLAALVFMAAGRHPVTGIAAAFAGVSGGFSANIIISPLDAIMAGISTEAAALVQPGYEVSAAANYYFLLASTLLITLVGTWITERFISPALGDYQGENPTNSEDLNHQLSAKERRGLKWAGLFSLLYIALLLATLVPEQGILRGAEGSILKSPFISGIVTLIALYVALAGTVYGFISGSFNKAEDIVKSMEASMGTMAGYIVLMFFAAQFVSYFSWSQLGSISAINGASFLQSLELPSAALLIFFVLVAALINLFIGSASAKWALFAPIFVPMFLLLGISPEATQMAYRIGDSSTNIITPLMPYYGVVIAFIQRYDKEAGIGTTIAIMLPYSVAFLLSWSVLLAVWIGFGWPLGTQTN